MEGIRGWVALLGIFAILAMFAWVAGTFGNPILKGMMILAGLFILGFCAVWFRRLRNVDGNDLRIFPGAGFVIGLVLLFSLWIHR